MAKKMKGIKAHSSCTDYVKWYYINVSWDGIEGTAGPSQMLHWTHVTAS